jgi:SRSO17 transposase
LVHDLPFKILICQCSLNSIPPSSYRKPNIKAMAPNRVAYGANTELRRSIAALDLTYVTGILPNTTVWAPGMAPARPKAWSGRGRPPSLMRRDSRHQPVSVKALALSLPAKAWRTVTWREGTSEPLASRFARLRVRAAHRDYNLTAARPEERLLIQWPKGEALPTKYWFSTLPAKISLTRLVDLTKLRWRIERDYQDLKQEIGLGYFEGRGWRGFHHHATLCIAAYGFLISERETIPPSGPRSGGLFQTPRLSQDYRPRGSATAHRASYPELDCDDATAFGYRARQTTLAMSLLRPTHQENKIQKFVTQ